jgi:hypothetical protein
LVCPALEEFGRGAIERDQHVAAQRVAGGPGRFGDEVERRPGRRDVRRKAALVANRGAEPLGVQPISTRGRSHPQRSASEKLGAPTGMTMNLVDRIRMGLIQNVHHRHR